MYAWEISIVPSNIADDTSEDTLYVLVFPIIESTFSASLAYYIDLVFHRSFITM